MALKVKSGSLKTLVISLKVIVGFALTTVRVIEAVAEL